MTCGGVEFGRPAPSNLKNAVPEYNRATLADYLHLSTTKVCLSGGHGRL
jgi:hypothetical protein